MNFLAACNLEYLFVLYLVSIQVCTRTYFCTGSGGLMWPELVWGAGANSASHFSFVLVRFCQFDTDLNISGKRES